MLLRRRILTLPHFVDIVCSSTRHSIRGTRFSLRIVVLGGDADAGRSAVAAGKRDAKASGPRSGLKRGATGGRLSRVSAEIGRDGEPG